MTPSDLIRAARAYHEASRKWPPANRSRWAAWEWDECCKIPGWLDERVSAMEAALAAVVPPPTGDA